MGEGMLGLASQLAEVERRLRRAGSRGNPYSVQRRVGFQLLRFAPVLEREYQQSIFEHARLRIRALSLLGALGVLAYDLIDRLTDSLMITPAMMLLSFGGIPVILSAYFASLRPHLTRWLRWVMLGAFSAYGLILSISIQWSRTVNPQMPYESLLLLTFADYLLSGLGIYLAAGAGVALLASYLVGGWLFGVQSAQQPYELFYLGLANIIGVIGLYALEYQARLSFLVSNELRLLSMHDGLTGLLNRRSFRRHLHRIWKQARREDKMLGLLRLDVDNFKRLNDEFGHAFGDRVLRVLAHALGGLSRRPLDAIGRVGGDEFEAVWYDPDELWFHGLGNRLRERLRHDLAEAGIDPKLVTLSGGARLVRAGNCSVVADLLRELDDTLHQVKRGGRDRIVSSG